MKWDRKRVWTIWLSTNNFVMPFSTLFDLPSKILTLDTPASWQVSHLPRFPSRSQATLLSGTCDCVTSPISGTFRASISFAWLAVYWWMLQEFSSLPDRILWRTFTQYSHVLTSQPGFVLHCDSVCLRAHSSFGQFGRTYQLLFRHVPQMLGKCPMSDCNFIHWFGATISTELSVHVCGGS